MKKVIIFLVFCSVNIFCYSQDKFVTDSLDMLYQSVKNDSLKIDLLLKLSKVYQANDLERSIEFSQTALEIAKKGDYPIMEAKVNNKMGILLYHLGRYDDSLDYFLRSKKIYEKLDNNNLLLGQVNNICGIYIQMEEYDKAMGLYQDIIYKQNKLLEKGDSTNFSQMHIFYNSLGVLYNKMEEYKLAQSYFKKALENAKDFKFHSRFGAFYNNLGSNLLELNEIGEALRYLNLSVEHCKEVNDKLELSKSYILLSRLYFSLQKNETAVDFANFALQVAVEIGAVESMEKAAFSLYKIYKEMGESSKALVAHEKYHQYQDSLFNERSVKEITRLQMMYDFNKQEEIRKVEEKKLLFKMSLIISILVFCIVLTGLLYLLNKSREKRLFFEKKSLEKDVELGNKELTMNVIYLLEKNELMKQIAKKLSEIKELKKANSREIIEQIIKDVEVNMKINVWEEFEIRFQKIHQSFYTNLRIKFPNLSKSDEKLSALLSLGMTSKEIAAITHQSIKSIEVARTRLRKKLNLTNTNTNLVEFLAKL